MVLLMDEPLANLDPPHQADWLRMVRELVACGRTVVSVLHEISLALHADELVILSQGQLAWPGRQRDDAATHRALEQVFDHRIAIHPLAGQWVALPKLPLNSHFESEVPMEIETPPTEKPYDKPEGERAGLVIVNTGDGKGKSTAAFGLALRAHGRGKAVQIYQFMKVPSARFGEHRMFEQIGIPIEGLGDGFSWKSQDLEHSAQLARDGWERRAPPSSRASIFWWCWTKSPTR
jgi:hypothetical protein